MLTDCSIYDCITVDLSYDEFDYLKDQEYFDIINMLNTACKNKYIAAVNDERIPDMINALCDYIIIKCIPAIIDESYKDDNYQTYDYMSFDELNFKLIRKLSLFFKNFLKTELIYFQYIRTYIYETVIKRYDLLLLEKYKDKIYYHRVQHNISTDDSSDMDILYTRLGYTANGHYLTFGDICKYIKKAETLSFSM